MSRNSQNTPLVSVIIPSYNRATHISKALNSVYAQTYRPIEVLVVDDGSTDNSKEVIQSWGKKHDSEGFKIRYIYQENAGAPAARNTGIENAKGKYLQFFDSDDALIPEKLTTQITLMKKEKTTFCICDYSHVNVDGSERQVMSNNKSVAEQIKAFKGQHTSIGVFDRSLFKNNRIRWNVKIKKRQDTDFYTKLFLTTSNYSYSPKVLFQWVRHENEGITNNHQMGGFIYRDLLLSLIVFHLKNIFRISLKNYPALIRYYLFLLRFYLSIGPFLRSLRFWKKTN